MNLKLNLVRRFLSDTPDFFKRLDLLGLFLVAVAGYMADNGYSGKWITIAGAVGAVLCLVSKFVKKDIHILQAAKDNVEALNTLLPEINAQVNEVIRVSGPIMEVIHRADPPVLKTQFPETPVDKPQPLR